MCTLMCCLIDTPKTIARVYFNVASHAPYIALTLICWSVRSKPGYGCYSPGTAVVSNSDLSCERVALAVLRNIEQCRTAELTLTPKALCWSSLDAFSPADWRTARKHSPYILLILPTAAIWPDHSRSPSFFFLAFHGSWHATFLCITATNR